MKKKFISYAAIFISSFIGALSNHSIAQETVAPVCTSGANCWQTIKPAEVDPRWSNARCNDGTPGSYQFRPSPVKSKDWVIVYEGGNACDDLTSLCSTRLANDKERTTTSIQSNNSWGKITHGGILSHKVENNPDFYNANLVLVDYCSSDFWSGASNWRRKNSATPNCFENDSSCGWYFSGRYNSSATIESLKQHHGLIDDGSQRVIFVGSSAGGFGLASNAESIKNLLPSTFASDGLRFVFDGSYLLNGWDEAGHKIGSSLITSMDYVAAQNRIFWRAQYETFCERDRMAQGLDYKLCLFASVHYPYLVSKANGLGLKVLIQNSTLDSVALKTLALTSTTDSARERWRCAMTNSLKKADWLFSSGEVYHTLVAKNSATSSSSSSSSSGTLTTNDLGFKAGPTGNTLREVISRFWQNKPAQQVVYNNPACTY